jgi:hypothetical protein
MKVRRQPGSDHVCRQPVTTLVKRWPACHSLRAVSADQGYAAAMPVGNTPTGSIMLRQNSLAAVRTAPSYCSQCAQFELEQHTFIVSSLSTCLTLALVSLLIWLAACRWRSALKTRSSVMGCARYGRDYLKP